MAPCSPQSPAQRTLGSSVHRAVNEGHPRCYSGIAPGLRGLLERNDCNTYCKPQVLAVFCSSINPSKRLSLTARNPTFLGHSVFPLEGGVWPSLPMRGCPRNPDPCAPKPGSCTGKADREEQTRSLLAMFSQALLSPPQLTVCVWERSIPRPSYSRVETKPALCLLQSQGQAQSGT